MPKQAATEYPINSLISERWSPRAFDQKAVPAEVLRSLFEAARWAPSSSNEQPWAYLVATKDNPAEFENMISVLVEFNAMWARSAPVLALAVSERNFAKNNTPNRNAHYDTGAASVLLCIEATARGLVVHQMAGFDADRARTVFNIPEGWDAIAAMAIGYPGDPNALPQSLKEREAAPRTRKPLREFVMTGQWGHTATFLS
jgi:nitroreductase